MSVQSVSLYYREGSSDKEYHASIEPAGPRFVVNFAYGRRGSTLNTGTKTNVPVDFEVAFKAFIKLVNEKKSKGYTEGEAGTPYQHSDKEERTTTILPQLLNPIDESELDALIEDDGWCGQEKHDGKHLLLRKEGAAIHGINKKGHLVGLPSPVVVAAHGFKQDFILDGESIGGHLHVFDILMLDGEDLRGSSYHARATVLLNLLFSGQQRHIHYVEAAWKSVPGQRYAVEACFELSSSGQWSTLSSNLVAPNFVMTLETNIALPTRFFRVRVD